MCFSQPKMPKPGAQAAPPAAAGADSLLLGAGTNDDALRNQGLLGRLALRVGRGSGTGTGGTGSDGRGGAPSGGSSSGSVGSGTGGSSFSVGTAGSGGSGSGTGSSGKAA